jgi:uncharacterized protein
MAICHAPLRTLSQSVISLPPFVGFPQSRQRKCWLANVEPESHDPLLPFPAEQMMMWPMSTGRTKPDRAAHEVEMKPNPVRHNAAQNRFEMDTPAGLAVADYRLAGNVMTIYHTEVPVPLRGSGYGYHLVRGTLEEVRRLNLKVVPQCWFVRQVIERRPEFQDLLG